MNASRSSNDDLQNCRDSGCWKKSYVYVYLSLFLYFIIFYPFWSVILLSVQIYNFFLFIKKKFVISFVLCNLAVELQIYIIQTITQAFYNLAEQENRSEQTVFSLNQNKKNHQNNIAQAFSFTFFLQSN